MYHDSHVYSDDLAPDCHTRVLVPAAGPGYAHIHRLCLTLVLDVLAHAPEQEISHRHW